MVFFLVFNSIAVALSTKTHPQIASANKLAWNCGARSRSSEQQKFDVPGDQERIVSFINSCDIPVQVGFTSGAMCASCSPSLPCPEGGLCRLGRCFFPSLLPAQSNPQGNYLRLSPGQKYNVSLTVSGTFGYGGAVYVSTGCETYADSCESAICNGKVCDPFTGPVGPHTRAEFFMDTVVGTDFYDVSLIHGVNVPIAMSPWGGVRPVNFTCQVAGAIQPFQSLPGCSYRFNPVLSQRGGAENLSSSVVFVAPPNPAAAQACKGDMDCPSPFRCGLAADRDGNGSPKSTVSRVCGKAVGLWSANEVCIYGQDFDAPFSCQQASGLPGGRNTDLYGCSGPYDFSGYGEGHGESNANVCGCVNWPQPTDSACNYDNAEWERVAYPWTKFLKQGCPTAYAYPYDDMTSSFRCTPQNPAQGVGYQFEFCPLATKVIIG